MMKKGYLLVIAFLLVISSVYAQDFTTDFIRKLFGIEESEMLTYFMAWAAFFIIFSQGTILVFRENRVAAVALALVMSLLTLRFIPKQFIETWFLIFLGITILLGPIAIVRWLCKSRKWRIVLAIIIYGIEIYLFDLLVGRGITKPILDSWYGASLSARLLIGGILGLLIVYVVGRFLLGDYLRPKITTPELEHRLDVKRDILAEKRARRRRR